MDDISPDLISRMASRIYNEAPSPNGHGTPQVAMPSTPSTPEMPAAPTSPGGIPPHMGHLPFSFPSVPHGGEAPGTSRFAPLVSSPGMPPVPAPNSPLNTGFSFPSAPQSPPAELNVPSDASSGLSAFVAKIRQSHFSGRDQQLDYKSYSAPERASNSSVIPTTGPRPLDVPAIREDFPILRQQIHGKQLAWFDNAATTQKPQSVIDAISRFYQEDYSNIHRGAHTLAARATDAYEKRGRRCNRS